MCIDIYREIYIFYKHLLSKCISYTVCVYMYVYTCLYIWFVICDFLAQEAVAVLDDTAVDLEDLVLGIMDSLQSENGACADTHSKATNAMNGYSADLKPTAVSSG